MTKPNENKNNNSLYAWATGDLSSIAIGLAVGTFIYKSGIIQKLTGRFFKSDSKTKDNFQEDTEINR